MRESALFSALPMNAGVELLGERGIFEPGQRAARGVRRDVQVPGDQLRGAFRVLLVLIDLVLHHAQEFHHEVGMPFGELLAHDEVVEHQDAVLLQVAGGEDLLAAVAFQLVRERSPDVRGVDVVALPGRDDLGRLERHRLDFGAIDPGQPDGDFEGVLGGRIGRVSHRLSFQFLQRADPLAGDQPFAGGDDLGRADHLDRQLARDACGGGARTEAGDVDFPGGEQRQHVGAGIERNPLDLGAERLLEGTIDLAQNPHARTAGVGKAHFRGRGLGRRGRRRQHGEQRDSGKQQSGQLDDHGVSFENRRKHTICSEKRNQK
ncbi:MAG: hypothetical protein QM701_00015 [Propionivibrio sp.]